MKKSHQQLKSKPRLFLRSVLLLRLALLTTAFLLSACAIPASQQILPELSYSKPVKTHSKKHLLLSLKSGESVPSDRSGDFFGGGVGVAGAIGNLIGAEITAEHNRHLNHKNDYEFDVNREAIFVRSLQKALLAHHVFRSVTIVPSFKTLKSSQVGMNITFNSTQVTGNGPACEITLDVLLRIETSAHAKKFSRVLFVQSGPPHHVTDNAYFLHQQKVVAKKLLSKIMTAIDQWDKQRA